MKVLVRDASDEVLDFMAAVCDGWRPVGPNCPYLATKFGHPTTRWCDLKYSSNWAIGGPVMDREGIGYFDARRTPGYGYCQAAVSGGMFAQRGETPLQAGMRCFVMNTMGGETMAVPDDVVTWSKK